MADENNRPLVGALPCPLCGGTGWLHGCQQWTAAKMRKGTPYYSARCSCVAKMQQAKGRKGG